MLNPIKTPMQMMYEQAGLPHYAGGKKVDIVEQFASRIQDAIRRYTRATGKPPTADEVKQLEDHIRGLSQPSTQPAQTQARLAQQTPYASHLVDEFGRPYRPMIDPRTGKLTTPERAQGFNVGDQFRTTPVSQKARKYEVGANAFTPDEFMQQANTGRLSTRTNQRSHTPSSEEMIAKQNAAEEIGDATPAGPLETYGLGEQPRSASEPFASKAAAFEQVPAGDIRQEILPAVYPREGDPRSKFAAEVEQARQSFRARGIEPDEEDLINAVIAARNPMRHNYTGENPIGQRPMADPTAGKISPEMLEWREKMRLAGQPEKTVTRAPSDWNPSSQRDYLLDTTPETRQPFAADWNVDEMTDRRRRTVSKAAGGIITGPMSVQDDQLLNGYEGYRTDTNNINVNDFGNLVGTYAGGGMTKSPRDMHAELMVNGYDKGGRTKAYDPVEYNRYDATRLADYTAGLPPGETLDTRGQERISEYNPSPKERIAELGQGFLEKIGIRRPIARRASQTVMGGPSSALPGNFGLTDVAAFHPAGFAATMPLMAAEMGHAVGQGDYTDAAMAAAMSYPGVRVAKGVYDKAKVIPTAVGRYATRNPRLVGGMGATGITGLNAYPDE